MHGANFFWNEKISMEKRKNSCTIKTKYQKEKRILTSKLFIYLFIYLYIYLHLKLFLKYFYKDEDFQVFVDTKCFLPLFNKC